MDDKHFLISDFGVRMPRIIYGTAWKKERTAALVEQAIGLGFRGIDTACQPKHYHEAGVGDGLAACIKRGSDRGEIYLQSKFTPLASQDPSNIPYDPNAELAEQVAQSFQVSLNNLQTSYLDCLVLHAPLEREQDTLAAWQAMEKLFHSGGVKQLGISNCYDLHKLEFICRNADIKPAVLQNRFYTQTGYDRGIREFCRTNRILYQSFWTLTANPHVLTHASLQKLAGNYQRSTAQIFFRFLSQIGIIPLTGTTSEQHMQEDLAIFDFELNSPECDTIEKILRT